jgi:hypothetical protein
VKIWGRARMVEDNEALVQELSDPGYKATPERALFFKIEAWDVNCPQHITPRFTHHDIEPTIGALKARIAELEAELETLKRDFGG